MHFTLKLGLYFLFFCSIFVFFVHPIGSDGDFYHHTTAGKFIIQSHTLPHLDTFTFTASGKEWIDHSWLSGIIFYLIDTAFGSFGISLFVAFIAVITLSCYFVG